MTKRIVYQTLSEALEVSVAESIVWRVVVQCFGRPKSQSEDRQPVFNATGIVARSIPWLKGVAQYSRDQPFSTLISTKPKSSDRETRTKSKI